MFIPSPETIRSVFRVFMILVPTLGCSIGGCSRGRDVSHQQVGQSAAASPSDHAPPAETQQATAVSVRPGPVDNPLYKSWITFQVGTTTRYELSIHNSQEGNTTTLPLYYELVERDAAHVMLKLNLPADHRATVPAVLPKSTTSPAENWPEILPQVGYLPWVESVSGHEVLRAGERVLDCEYGSRKLANLRIKQWFSKEVPGGLVRAEVEVEGKGLKIEQQLTDVKVGKSTKKGARR